MFKHLLLVLTLTVGLINQSSADEKLYDKFQKVSVTVKSGAGEGSGTIITREVTVAPNQTVKMSFVWTAAHVIDNLRTVRPVVSEGKISQKVEFRDAQVVQELIENGRRVGETKMDAKVIKYSDSEEGEDLALLLIRKTNFTNETVEFYQGNSKPVSIGTELYHVGSLLGQVGSNSMTRGIMSQVGRVLNLGSGDGVVFDQTTVTAFPGSSGGGVFLSETSGENEGQYVGMLVRGAGETFNLIVPVRRLRAYAKSNGVGWAVDTNVAVPPLQEILEIPIEGEVKQKTSEKTKTLSSDSKMFPILPTIQIQTKASNGIQKK